MYCRYNIHVQKYISVKMTCLLTLVSRRAYSRVKAGSTMYFFLFLVFCYFLHFVFLLLIRCFYFISPEIKINELRKKQKIQEIQLSIKWLQRRKKAKDKKNKKQEINRYIVE